MPWSIVLLAALLAGPPAPPAEPPFVPPPGLATGWYASVEPSRGRVLVRLLPDQAPQSVAHFVGLAEGTLEWSDPVTGEARKGRYYDGASVYEARAGRFFGIGDRAADGTYSPLLFVPPPSGTPRVNFYSGWRVANVKVGQRASAARVMFLIAPLPALNYETVCFGEIVDGQETVHEIAGSKTGRGGRPIEPVRIERVRVFAVGEPPPLPAPVPFLPEPVPLVPAAPN